MVAIGLKIGATARRAHVVGDTGPDALTIDGTAPYRLVDGTIAAIVVDDITYTSDVNGNALSVDAFADGPVCIVPPKIAAQSLAIGDATGFNTGFWLFDAEKGAPLLTHSWMLDGVSVLDDAPIYTSTSNGALTLQEIATQPLTGSRTVTSAGVSITSRSVADIIADHGGDYYDFADLTRIYQDRDLTPVTADGQTVGRVHGIAGVIDLYRDASSRPVTFDAVSNALAFDGETFGLQTEVLDSGPGFTVVAAVTLNTAGGRHVIAHHHNSSSDRSMMFQVNDGFLETIGVTETSVPVADRNALPLSAGVKYVLSGRVSAANGQIMGQVDGANRSETDAGAPLIAHTNKQIVVGWKPGFSLDGLIKRLVIISAASVSEADLITLENWVGEE